MEKILLPVSDSKKKNKKRKQRNKVFHSIHLTEHNASISNFHSTRKLFFYTKKKNFFPTKKMAFGKNKKCQHFSADRLSLYDQILRLCLLTLVLTCSLIGWPVVVVVLNDGALPTIRHRLITSLTN